MELLSARQDRMYALFAQVGLFCVRIAQENRHSSDLDVFEIDLHPNYDGVQLIWRAKDMSPRYHECFADCWNRDHWEELRKSFPSYHLCARPSDDFWTIDINLCKPNKVPKKICYATGYLKGWPGFRPPPPNCPW